MILKDRIRIYLPESDFSLWVAFFLWTMAIGAFLQGVILPFLLPQSPLGGGAVIGNGFGRLSSNCRKTGPGNP